MSQDGADPVRRCSNSLELVELCNRREKTGNDRVDISFRESGEGKKEGGEKVLLPLGGLVLRTVKMMGSFLGLVTIDEPATLHWCVRGGSRGLNGGMAE